MKKMIVIIYITLLYCTYQFAITAAEDDVDLMHLESHESEDDKVSDIANWLKTEHLQKLIPLFEQENMTLNELIKFAEDEKNFMKYLNSLNVPQPSIYRILSKIQKLRDPKPVIVISEKERHLMDILDERNVKITELIEQLSHKKDTVIETEKTIRSKIDTEYEKLIDLINNHKQRLLKKLGDISKKKQSEISIISQQLEKQENNIKNSRKKCKKLVGDVNMDRDDRKNQIISIVDEIMNEEIAENMEIILEFNEDIISSFLSNLGDVYGEERHRLPIIDNVESEEITETEACDTNDGYNPFSILSSYINWDLLKAFGFYVVVCFGVFVLLLLLCCVLPYDRNLNFLYSDKCENKGIICFIGTNYGQNKQWINPSTDRKIKLKSSGWSTSYGGSIVDFLEREPKESFSKNIENGWICIDFGKNITIKPTAYSLQHNTCNHSYLKSWNVFGSDDGSNWHLISKHSYSLSPFNKPKQLKIFNIKHQNEYYQMFKIQITEKNSNGNWNICCTGFEIYGHLCFKK